MAPVLHAQTAPKSKRYQINNKKQVSKQSSRKHDSLPIQRPPITPNPLPPKPLLHTHPTRLIEIHPPNLHNPINLLLRPLIQPRSTIFRLDVLGQIKVGAVEAGFRVFREGRAGREPHVAETVQPVGDVRCGAVDVFRDCTGGCYVGDWGGVGFPLGAGQVEDWVDGLVSGVYVGVLGWGGERTGCADEEEEGEGVEEEGHVCG